MDTKKPMKILDFPARHRVRRPLREGIASVETLLGDYLGRQAAFQQNGRRLQASLARLSLLTRDMVRSTERLRHTLGRLRACHRGPVPPSASS